MPASLLAMSREVLRTAFSHVIPKQTYTFTCTRSNEVTPLQLKKLKVCVERSGVVVATPTTIKALLLRFVQALADYDWAFPDYNVLVGLTDVLHPARLLVLSDW